MFAFNWSVMKGTFLGEQSTLVAACRLQLDVFFETANLVAFGQ
jgi:hypothetical protein